jgi:ankyrin repeat protein
MPRSLPARPSLEWLKKSAKDELKRLRSQNPAVLLAEAQLALAREYGFDSWRKLKRHINEREQELSSSPIEPPLTRDQVVQGFLRLVGTGQIDEVRRVLTAAPQMVNVVGPHPFWGGRPQPLHVAIETKRRDMFELLLDAGADVNGTSDQYDHWSPLMLTRDQNRDDMRDELLRRGARVGLMEALIFGDDVRVEELLRPGKDALPPYAPNGGSVLNFARTRFAIDRLLELGVPTDVKDRWGATPIESMSRLGPRGQELVRHLIARGVSAAPEEYARLGDLQTLQTIIERDPQVIRSDAVMMGAVDFGHQKLVEWLLARGGNVNARARSQSRHTALHSAAWNGDLPMARLLVDAGADVRARDEEHDGTPLDWARVAIEVTNNPKCRQVVEYLSQFTPDLTTDK